MYEYHFIPLLYLLQYWDVHITSFQIIICTKPSKPASAWNKIKQGLETP